MQELDIVFSDYAKEKLQYGRIPIANTSPAITSVRAVLPNVMSAVVLSTGRAAAEYSTQGSVGEAPLNFAKVPWVSLFKRNVTTSATRGFYIVLLFSEDGAGAALTLNQGFVEYRDLYKTKTGLLRARQCADLVADLIPTPPTFSKGALNIGATSELGLGYEQACIFHKKYVAGQLLSKADFESDLAALLQIYDDVYSLAGVSLQNLRPPPNEGDFQAAAEAVAASNDPAVPGSTGPQAPPVATPRIGGKTYPRSAKVSGTAIKMYGYACAAEGAAPHTSFVSKATKKNYVEAHHLVPFGQQAAFMVSLDVEENVVPLCPTCHRLLHHGRMAEKAPILRRLLASRSPQLKARGIEVDDGQLREMYGALTDLD